MSIVLDAVNKQLEIVLAGVVAANQLPFVASYADYDDAAPGFTPGENDGVTNNAVVVTLVAAPGAGEQRLVNNISVFNRDTAAVDVTIQYDNAGVDREIVKVNLAVGYSLHFREDQWQVLDTNGAVRMVLDTGVALQHDILSNTHGDAAVDAVTRGSLIYGNATPKWDELVIGGATEYLKSDGVGVSWAAVDFDDLSGDCDLADLAGYARGSIIRGGAADWEAHAAETNHFILVGDGVDVSSKPFDWDDMAAGAGADMVHSHQAAGEGGQIDHGLALTGLGDDDHTQYLLADGTRALSGPWAPGQIITMINEGLHILDTDASHDLIIKAGSDLTVDRILSFITGDAARTITLTGDPTLDDWFDQGVKQADSPTFAGVTLPAVTFNGATGTNVITLPDNLADALHLSDAGGIEYLKIISTDAQPVIRFNDGGVDVDFEVEAVGVADALQVRGADGQITLGVLTAGFVKSNAGGILSMAVEVALAELASYTQGDLIVGGAADWVDLAIGGAHQILKVNAGATDPAWASFDWDDMSAGAGADMVHDHSAAGEGGATLGFTAMTGAGVDVPDDWYIGIGAALERIVFDTVGDICVMGAKFGVGWLTPLYKIDAYVAGANANIRVKQTGAGDFGANFVAETDDATAYFGAYDDGYVTVPEYAGKTVFQGGDEVVLAAVTATGEIQMYTGGRLAAHKRFVLEDDGHLYNTATDGTYAATLFNDGNHVDRHVLELQGGADNGAAVGTTYYIFARDGNGDPTGNIKTVNGVFQLADVSDELRKANIKDTGIIGLDIVNALRVRDYNWKANPKAPVMTSFVAQEAQKVYPDMVGEAPDGTLMTSRGLLIPILTKAIQELDARLIKGGL